MGYEIKAIIGIPSSVSHPEHARSKQKKYSDGSGFKYLKRKGKFIETGRTSHWFEVMCDLDLCKLGYQDDALNKLIQKSHESGKANAAKEFYYFYGIDGNTEITEDKYGAIMWPVPVAEVVAAIQASLGDEPYRRLKWLLTLLKSMSARKHNIHVMFYGH